MSNNFVLDQEAFKEGCRAVLKEAGGMGDWMGRMAHPLDSMKEFYHKKVVPMGGKIMGDMTKSWAQQGGLDTAKQVGNVAGEAAGKGVVNGAVDGVGSQLKGVGDHVGNFMKGLGTDPMGTMKNNPWTTGIAGAGVLGAGYLGGKAFGLWGNDNNQQSPGSNGQAAQPTSSNGFSPPPRLQSAYTPGYAPQALSKAGSDFALPAKMLGRLSPSIALGSGIYSAVNRHEYVPDENDTHEVNITPHGMKARKLLQNPKMREYVNSLASNVYH